MLGNLIPNFVVNVVISVFLAIKKIVDTGSEVFRNARERLRVGL